MNFQNQWLDDLAKIAMGAIQVGMAAREEVKHHIKGHINHCADRLGVIKREEFELLRERLDKLEQK